MRTLFITLFALLTVAANAQEFSFVLISSQTNSSGNTRMDSITYSFNGPNVAMLKHGRDNEPDVRVLFDPESKSIMQLHTMNGLKGGFVFAMSEKRWPGMTYSEELPGGKVEYTGKEKEIQGHTCKEMKVASAEYTGTAWVAEDIALSMVRVFSYQSVGAGEDLSELKSLQAMGMNGLPLEMDLKSTQGKPDVQLWITNYRNSVDTSMFDTEGHKTTFVAD